MSQDFKTPISVNGVPVSMQGHQHDFNTFPVLVSKMGKSNTQTYTANVNTKVAFNTNIFNNGLIVDTTNNRVTTPSAVSGVGIFDIRANIDLNSTSTMYIYIYVNGVQVDQPYYISTALNQHWVSTMLQLTPDDYVEIYIKGATARTIQTTSTFSIRQVA